MGKVIVVPKSMRNATSLRTLGDQLHAEGSGRDHFIVFVYDDVRAARLRDQALNEKLGPKDMAYHDKHMIASYTKNASTGYDVFTLDVDGIGGPFTKVTY